MITKEQSEYLDAISRELGDAMSPFQELLLLGFNIEWFYRRIYSRIDNETAEYGNDDDEDIDPTMEYDYEEEVVNYGYIEGEYDFDEENEDLRQLGSILRFNNDRKKYFA